MNNIKICERCKAALISNLDSENCDYYRHIRIKYCDKCRVIVNREKTLERVKRYNARKRKSYQLKILSLQSWRKKILKCIITILRFVISLSGWKKKSKSCEEMWKTLEKEYLTIRQFAEAVGKSQQAIHQQLETRLKKYVKVIDNRKYIDNTAIREVFGVDNLKENQVILSMNWQVFKSLYKSKMR